MALSYCTATRITSGYIRGTKSARLSAVIELLGECAKPVCHPFLLPFLMLHRELSPDMEKLQRDIREKLRGMEIAVSKRYGHIGVAAPGYVAVDIGLDSVNRTLADYQCNVMQKRPQSWIGAIKKVDEAITAYWKVLSAEPNKDKILVPMDLHLQQRAISRRLGFMVARLEGLESYAQVTLERLNIQREVVGGYV